VSRKFLETIKAVDGKLYHLEYHQARLERLFETLNADAPHRLKSLLSPPKEGFYRCRVLYDTESISVEYIAYTKRKVTSLKVLVCDTIEYALKYEDRSAIDQLFKRRGGCDDILIVKNGLLRDTSIANVAFYDGKNWLTPKTPLLHGVTRERLLDEGKIKEADITLLEIKRFKKIALMNAMIDFDIIAEENIGEVIC
jgi:4-amino-4-deoxychorismate lyase